MYFKSHYVQVFWSKFFTVAVKAKSVSMRPFWVLTTYQRCKYIFWMSGFSKTCCMEPLHSFFECFFYVLKKDSIVFSFLGECCDACFAVRHSQWRGMGGGGRETGKDDEGAQCADSTCCILKGRCRRLYPITPFFLSTPQRNAATRDSRWHFHGSSQYRTYAATHVNSVVFWVYADVLVIIMRMTNSTRMSLKMCLFFAHEDFETSLWAGACQLYCDIILVVPLKVTSASSLRFQRCCPWLPRIFASRAPERATD